MKKVFYLIAILAFVSCQSATKNKTEEKSSIETAQIVESTINIGGMHCEMCVASIEKGVSELEGVISVAVSLGDSTAVVSFDKLKLDETKIEEVIEARGYSIKTEM